VELPITADGSVRLTDDTSHLGIGFTMVAAKGSRLATTAEGIALYAGAGPRGADVVHRVHAEGTEDYVVFESRPEREELDYEVDVSQVAGLRLVSRVLEFLDSHGTPVLRVAPPYVVDAHGRASAARMAVEGCSYDVDPSGPWGRAVTAAGAATCTLRVVWESASYPAIVDPVWVATGYMTVPRQNHTATLLPSGQVLVAGGTSAITLDYSSAELFDESGTFAATGSMATARQLHTATLLPSGKVLVAGGEGNSAYLPSAELFDGAGTFAVTGTMLSARASHTATLLPSGKVLVAGGYNGSTPLSGADLFDGTSTFASTGLMTTVRSNHTATLLPSGRVLVAGGIGFSPAWLSSAELFDGTGSFAATGSMTIPREAQTATLLPSGQVLVAGGDNGGTAVSTAELFDGTSLFAATGSMPAQGEGQTATLLRSGKVLVAGGNIGTSALANAALFDGSATFSVTSSMTRPRFYHTQTVLSSGRVLVTGGYDSNGGMTLAAAEIFDLAAAGGACAIGDDCVSGVCVGTVCCAGACSAATSSCDAAGTCLLNDGQPSTSTAACSSGFVSDGVCCNSACASACDVCTAALGAGKGGTCSTAPAGYSGSPACGNGLACDGTHVKCPLLPCAADLDCLPADYCTSNGTCTVREPLGSACASADCKTPPCRQCSSNFCVGGVCTECAQDSDCTSGHCVDSVCCNRACTGVCESCAAKSTSGTCTPIAGSPAKGHGTCPAADAGDPCAQTSCDGIATMSCNAFVGATATCGAPECVNGQGQAAGVCNSHGSCRCINGSTCGADGHTLVPPTGPPTDCAPYACLGSACLQMCTTAAECVAPSVCNAGGQCVAPPSSGSGNGGGCELSPGASSGETFCTLGWLALVVARGRRRGRSR